MDRHGLAEDLLEEKYQSFATIQAHVGHIAEVLQHFFTHISLQEAWHGGQEQGLPWGAVRSLDEIIGDEHLQDRGFFVEVEHPELARTFTYPGASALYSRSPGRISRRAPLIGEHNVEILCGELGLTMAELAALAESRLI
jgi:crotonobetainyl-CoA:carnitine CoA-transferase CaiB-like acyl-CoA transferase